MKIRQLIYFGLIISSCNNPTPKKEVSIEAVTEKVKTVEEPIPNLDPKFAAYVNKIDSLSLPYEISCFDFSSYDKTEEDNDRIDRTYASEWYIPYRKIETNKPFEIIMYLSPADIYIPVIKTFSSDGKAISELQLFTNCGGDPGYKARQFIEIRSNHEIVRIDSTWRWELDAEYREIESTKQIKVTRTVYRIENNGIIKKKDEKTVHNKS